MASKSGTSAPPINKLTCPVCCDKFKQPKMLPCGHSFCEQCLFPVLEKRPSSCPVCRKTVKVTSVDRLPINFSLKMLVESDNRVFQKASKSRLFGECSKHGHASDQYCRSCEMQVCKDCVEESHASTAHEIAPVAYVVVEQRDKLEVIMKDIYRAEKEISGIRVNVSNGATRCQAEASQLLGSISDAADETNQATAEETANLKFFVERNKKDILEKVSSMRETCSELSLFVDQARDISQSFHKDLETHNVSRSNVMELLSRKRDEALKRIAHLRNRNDNFTIGLKFCSESTPNHVGRLLSSIEGSIPSLATKLKTTHLSDPVSCGFIWPEITWMVNLSNQKSLKHNFLKISNYHFLRDDFVTEIGISKLWITVTMEMSHDGRSILCLTKDGVHRFTFPPNGKLTEPGEISNTVVLRNAVSITWDEKRLGCYALLGDGRTIMHLDMDGCKVTREVVKLFEKVRVGTRWGAHPIHVSSSGSLAVCDQQTGVIHFYEALESGDPPKIIRAPEGDGYASLPLPECAMVRKEDNLWYVLWKMKSGSSGFNKVVLYAYDSSFKILGFVAEHERETNRKYGDHCSLCFQGEYAAIKVYDQVDVFHLT